MGLSISVGLLADLKRNDTEGYEEYREAFGKLSAALAKAGVDWQEPETGDGAVYSGGFPYGYLTRLRRIYVLAQEGDRITPAPAHGTAEERRDRERIDDEMVMFSSHLLCHADDAGYYIPVAFDDPLFLPEGAEIAGAGMVGSSQALLAELIGIAPALGIELDEKGGPTARAGTDLEATPSDDPFEPERYAWCRLYEACRAGIASGRAVVFC